MYFFPSNHRIYEFDSIFRGVNQSSSCSSCLLFFKCNSSDYLHYFRHITKSEIHKAKFYIKAGHIIIQKRWKFITQTVFWISMTMYTMQQKLSSLCLLFNSFFGHKIAIILVFFITILTAFIVVVMTMDVAFDSGRNFTSSMENSFHEICKWLSLLCCESSQINSNSFSIGIRMDYVKKYRIEIFDLVFSTNSTTVVDVFRA